MLAGLVLTMSLPSACEPQMYSQTINISVEVVNVSGRLARVEHYRDGELVNSLNLIDGNGDGIIDGKSGPSQAGKWPKGWQWFDDLYHDVTVGYSTIEVTGDHIRIVEGNTYEFVTGKYECEHVD